MHLEVKVACGNALFAALEMYRYGFGGCIGTLYYCTECYYIGPVTIEISGAGIDGQHVLYRDILEGGTFWSETGIGNRALF